jgi:hypothetical protein
MGYSLSIVRTPSPGTSRRPLPMEKVKPVAQMERSEIRGSLPICPGLRVPLHPGYRLVTVLNA